ncbi:hypothetical protein [Corynebacterium wankanglinii]|uniref:hypothetical protein n=1 Tax=Corynebacterium wankanglinii TaxID=2735136 RepID=UPI0015E6196B|nr:hypothetical protein [Corynebacterium wankanglinii]
MIVRADFPFRRWRRASDGRGRGLGVVLIASYFATPAAKPTTMTPGSSSEPTPAVQIAEWQTNAVERGV